MVDMAVALAGSDCERLRSGWLAQPANAVSALAYVAVGVWLLWRSRRAGVRRGPLLAGAVAMVGVGVGSFAYHGPQPGWAPLAHDGSVVWLALVTIGTLLSHPRATTEMAKAAWRAAAGWTALTLAAYLAGRTGSSLCQPAALWQPHAAWHVLSAVGLGFVVMGCSARFNQGCSEVVPEQSVRP
jgi:hypothetical protein